MKRRADSGVGAMQEGSTGGRDLVLIPPEGPPGLPISTGAVCESGRQLRSSAGVPVSSGPDELQSVLSRLTELGCKGVRRVISVVSRSARSTRFPCKSWVDRRRVEPLTGAERSGGLGVSVVDVSVQAGFAPAEVTLAARGCTEAAPCGDPAPSPRRSRQPLRAVHRTGRVRIIRLGRGPACCRLGP